MEKIDIIFISNYNPCMRIPEIVFVYQMREEEEIRWHSRYHSHKKNQYEVHYFIQGDGKFSHRSGIHLIRPGTIFYCLPEENHEIIVSTESIPLTYYAVLFELDSKDEELKVLADQILPEFPFFSLGSNYRLYFEELKEKSKTDNRNLAASAVHQFISFLYLLPETEHGFHYGDSRNVHIEKTLKALQESVFGNLDLNELSDRVGLNKSYLIRLFREKMGTTPMRYLRRLKIDTAKTMLRTTTQPIYEIAEKLQFYSEFHFSKTFKGSTGVAPRVFRNLE